MCHGFGGYFEAELYPGVMLSIHPDTHTPNMASWFPIYFPVREPFYVPRGETALPLVLGRHALCAPPGPSTRPS